MRAWYPATLDEALRIRAEEPDAVPLAGGTDLMVEVNAGRRTPGAVLALRRVRELQRAERDRIGSGVHWKDLLHAPDPALAQAARSVGSPQIRAAGTLGGNLGTASPAGDGLVVLAALDAGIELASRRRGTRIVPWSAFLTGAKRAALAPDELIAAVLLPPARPTRSEFAKVGIRGAMVIAVVNACVARHADGHVAIALGSVAPTVVRARRAEQLVDREGRLTPAVVDEVTRLIADEITPISDQRSTAEYRRHAAGVVVTRLLRRVFEA